jgi:hypothetical protein
MKRKLIWRAIAIVHSAVNEALLAAVDECPRQALDQGEIVIRTFASSDDTADRDTATIYVQDLFVPAWT